MVSDYLSIIVMIFFNPYKNQDNGHFDSEVFRDAYNKVDFWKFKFKSSKYWIFFFSSNSSTVVLVFH